MWVLNFSSAGGLSTPFHNLSLNNVNLRTVFLYLKILQLETKYDTDMKTLQPSEKLATNSLIFFPLPVRATFDGEFEKMQWFDGKISIKVSRFI